MQFQFVVIPQKAQSWKRFKNNLDKNSKRDETG
jgi:hypothetical protein